MDLLSVRVAGSPSAPRRVRLSAEIACDDRPGRAETWWIEVPEERAGALSTTGTPWLAAMLPLAATLGEPLRLRVPVDATLLAGARRILRTWHEWYLERFPEIREVAVEAETLPASSYAGARENAAFFSGGVDSFYMVVTNGDPGRGGGLPPIDRLVTVGGFDVPLAAREELGRLRERLARAAEELGRAFLDVGTNLRETRFREARWGNLAHGCALAAVGLALEPMFASLSVAGTHYDGPVKPWGSHPATDALLSTGATRIFHHACGVARREKTESLVRSPAAMRHLRVCYRSRTADNCGDCHKCYLTMLTLEVAGARCQTLPPAADLRRVARMYVRSNAYIRLYRDLAGHAKAVGRRDVARAIERCLEHSRRLGRWLAAADWLGERRGLWRIARRLRPRLLALAPVREPG
ncbi:MAG TPA: hypothetical protein VH854_03425 [Thermoanaerobaculia bacterium]|jgi:hypothetical protein|nr:hypothetical protein [Thermoanaerobaculia bacterium]